jgi:L-ribulose-5-phosphate 4-epimerase
MSKYEKLKHQAYTSNMDLPKHGLVLYTFGNASVVDRDNSVFAIKPSGVDYNQLKPSEIIIVDFDGNVVEGTLNPSSDTKTHLELYKNFPHINSVVHTHSTYAVAWAQAGRSIPVLGTTHADHLHVDIPITEFMTAEMTEGDYEVETGIQIVKLFENISYKEVEMVLVAGHGPFTWGDSPEKAVYNSVILEELAKMAYLSLNINPQVKPLPKHLIQKHYSRKHGPDSYYGQK